MLGFLKWWVSPANPWVFLPKKKISTWGVKWGVPVPPFKETPKWLPFLLQVQSSMALCIGDSLLCCFWTSRSSRGPSCWAVGCQLVAMLIVWSLLLDIWLRTYSYYIHITNYMYMYMYIYTDLLWMYIMCMYMYIGIGMDVYMYVYIGMYTST